MFNALGGLFGDAIDLVEAVVEIPVAMTRAVTKPIADTAQEMKDALLDDLDD
jgi:hypothetical protein